MICKKYYTMIYYMILHTSPDERTGASKGPFSKPALPPRVQS